MADNSSSSKSQPKIRTRQPGNKFKNVSILPKNNKLMVQKRTTDLKSPQHNFNQVIPLSQNDSLNVPGFSGTNIIIEPSSSIASNLPIQKSANTLGSFGSKIVSKPNSRIESNLSGSNLKSVLLKNNSIKTAQSFGDRTILPTSLATQESMSTTNLPSSSSAAVVSTSSAQAIPFFVHFSPSESSSECRFFFSTSQPNINATRISSESNLPSVSSGLVTPANANTPSEKDANTQSQNKRITRSSTKSNVKNKIITSPKLKKALRSCRLNTKNANIQNIQKSVAKNAVKTRDLKNVKLDVLPSKNTAVSQKPENLGLGVSKKKQTAMAKHRKIAKTQASTSLNPLELQNKKIVQKSFSSYIAEPQNETTAKASESISLPTTNSKSEKTANFHLQEEEHIAKDRDNITARDQRFKRTKTKKVVNSKELETSKKTSRKSQCSDPKKNQQTLPSTSNINENQLPNLSPSIFSPPTLPPITSFNSILKGSIPPFKDIGQNEIFYSAYGYYPSSHSTDDHSSY